MARRPGSTTCVPVSAFALLTALGMLLGGALAASPANGVPRPHPVRSSSGDWSTYLGSVARDGDATRERLISPQTAPTLHPIWNITTGGYVVSEPAVAGGRVVFGSWDGYEYGANATNGTVLWRTFTGITPCSFGGPSYGVSSSSTLESGNDYFGGGGEDWEDLNSATGRLRWEVFTGNNSTAAPGGAHYNWASPLIYRGNAYIGIATPCSAPLSVGQLLMVNLTTHRVVATFNTTNSSRPGGSIWSSPSVDVQRGILFVSTGDFSRTGNDSRLDDDSILALDARNLTEVEHFHVPANLEVKDGDFGAGPTQFTGANGRLMVGATDKDGWFFALHRYNFTSPAWALQLSTSPSNSPASFDGRNLYLTGTAANISGPHSPNGNVTRGTHVNGTLWSVNASTGKVNWVDALSGPSLAAPIFANGVVMATGGREFLVANASDGAKLFEWNASKAFYGAASVSGGIVYLGNNNGHLYAFTVNGTNGTGGGGGLPKLLAPTLGGTATVVAVPRRGPPPPAARERVLTSARARDGVSRRW